MLTCARLICRSERGMLRPHHGKTRVADRPLIMCIEDDPSVHEAMKGLLSALGFSTAMFFSAEEFLRSDRIKQGSCLIMDVKLSGMSGIELHNHLVASENHIPVIFITAFPDDTRREQALRAGAVCFLIKPASKEQLISCIGHALNLRAHHPDRS
jgi:FixJ family two-component response regulator